MKPRRTLLTTVSLAIVVMTLGGHDSRAGDTPVGHAYLLNNDVAANGVVILDRFGDGTLGNNRGSPAAAGGKGLAVPSGGDFDAQGAVRIVGNRLFAVNPGSDTIAVFDITDNGDLKPVPGSPFPSGGSTPLSIAVHEDLVYVANQAVPFANPSRAPNVTGFRLDGTGRLSPIADSTIDFPAGQGPAQVEFNAAGTVLAVTAGFQSDGRVRTFAVKDGGRLQEGPGSPFNATGVSGTVGFSWSPEGHYLMVSNFRGSAVTVFSVEPSTAVLAPLGAPYPNDQRAMCWTALAPDGKTLYTANFVSNSVSAYSIEANGKLSLLGSTPKRSANRPDSKDLAVAPDGKYLYLVGPIATQVAVFAIGKDRLSQELPESRSPFVINGGQWTTGIALN